MAAIRLKSGTMFDPLNPDPSLIKIEDIAYGLAGQYRFAGHSRYLVAQHSVLGSEYIGVGPEALGFLLHDAEEGLGLPDVTRPVKYDPSFTFYRSAGRKLQDAVGKRFNVTLQTPTIDFVDKAIRRTEQRFLFGLRVPEGEAALPIEIELWSPERAEEEFLQRFHLLTSPTTFTTGEYGKSIGLSRHAALVRLTKLERRGIVERVKVRQNQGGIVRPNVLGWRFLDKEVVDLSDRRSSISSEESQALVDSDSTGYSGSGGPEVVWSGRDSHLGDYLEG